MIFLQQKIPLLLLLALLSLTGCSPFSSKLQPAELTQLPPKLLPLRGNGSHSRTVVAELCRERFEPPG